MPNQCSKFKYVSEMGGAKIYFLNYWSRNKLSGSQVVWYCLEMPSQYSPFHYAPGQGVVIIYFLKNWSRKKLMRNKVVGYCLEMPNQCSPSQYVPERGGAKIYFLKHWPRKNIPILFYKNLYTIIDISQRYTYYTLTHCRNISSHGARSAECDDH